MSSSSSSSSSSFSSIPQEKYVVFLSFRGKDTRYNFTDHLYAALKRRGIVTFKDDRNLEIGEEMASELLKTIQESWCSVIVLSKTYAFSSCCLEELAAIVQQKKERDHKVFPIFYDVDPSNLRRQAGIVEEAFAKHEERYKENKNKILRWRSALTEVANMSGCVLEKNKSESKFIEGVVQKIYSVVPRELIRYVFSSKDFMPSKSSTLTFNQIIDAINTIGVNVIGLYGMPGVGKTTLAEEVKRHVEEQKLFDNVVMVTMSQTPNINKIQDRIAESLRLKLEARTEEGKAEELCWRLKDLKNIFVIVDDVWNEFEWQRIGIPSDVAHQDRKFLLTTRLEKVCVQMNCQKQFQLDILPEDEAWALFKVMADPKDVSLTLNNVAKEVASECKGLPLAIVAVGKALKAESLDGWIAANKRFKDSRHSDNEDVCEGVYSSLRLSYDYLKGDNIRSCFLLCSLFPEDCQIDIDLLIMFAIGQGLFFDIDLLNDLRREICEAVKKIHDSGLLLKIDDSGGGGDDLNVRMHDVVRDFAHWIASKGENMFMVKEWLAEWPSSKRFDCYTAICFWNNRIKNFPENLDLSKLKILHFEKRFAWILDSRSSLVRVPSAFVEGMKALRVLHLEDVTFSLEVSKFLKNLLSLCLVRCRVENISLLRNMENLEILEFIDTDIYEVPEELLALHRLNSLHFSCKQEAIKFPPNLLSRLMSLQELHVTCENNVNLLELNSLSRLTTLSLRVSTAQCILENFMFPKLQRYTIGVNQRPLFSGAPNFRALTIYAFSSSLKAFEELLCNVKELILKNIRFREHGNIVPGVDQEGLNALTSLRLESCKDLECIMDTTGDKGPTTTFSDLVKLHVSKMSCLKELWHGPPPINMLQKLKDVNIGYCTKLKVVFQMDDVLEKEDISGSTPLLSNLTCLELNSLQTLRCIWKGPIHLVNLQGLKTMRITKCDGLSYLFPAPLAQSLVNLEELVLKYCKSLEHVIIEEAAENGDEIVSNRDGYSLCWPKLKTVKINDCGSLKSVFPITWAQGLPDLEYFEITDCPQLKQVFNMAKTKGGRPQEDILLQRLRILKLQNLKKLSSFCPENFVMLLSLEEFEVRNCPLPTGSINQQVVAVQAKFEDVPSYDSKGLSCDAKKLTMDGVKYQQNLIPNVHPEGLNEITFLTLKHGKGLECLIDTTDQGHALTGAFFNLVELVIEEMSGLKMLCKGRFPKGFMQKLESLEVKDCMEMVSLSPPLQNLKNVRIMNCGQLQGVFETEEFLHDMEENKAPRLSNLTSLELRSLPELKWIWKGLCHYVSLQSLKFAKIYACNRLKYLFSPALAQSLVLLEELVIECCDGLEYIITTGLEVDDDNIKSEGGRDDHLPSLFPKLTSLQIIDCPRLEYVFKIPMAQGLPHLKSLYVSNATQLKQVFKVGKERNGADDAIALPRLQHLQLKKLINLCCFCSENYPIVAPSLEKFTVETCPGLENFAMQQQVEREVQLKELQLCELENDTVCDPIEKIFQIKVGHFLSKTQVIKLKNINQLQGPIQAASLQYLSEFEVTNCNRLKSLFSSMLARNMPQLKILRIKSCLELEEIIEIDRTSIVSTSRDHLQTVSFPSLEELMIVGCSNLKSLFPISFIYSLSNLEKLRIQGASKLEQVFGYQAETNVEHYEKEIVFPKLWDFNLSKLSSLKSLAPVGYHFRCPLLIDFKVIECPMLTTSSSMDQKTLVHAITE